MVCGYWPHVVPLALSTEEHGNKMSIATNLLGPCFEWERQHTIGCKTENIDSGYRTFEYFTLPHPILPLTPSSSFPSITFDSHNINCSQQIRAIFRLRCVNGRKALPPCQNYRKHIIIVNTCQKIYLNCVVGIFSTCLCNG